MKRILITYHSQSGHTEAMALAIAEGARSVQGVVVLVKPATATTNEQYKYK